MSDSARQKMRKARSELVLDHPFFANLALRLEMREDPNCRTAWADGTVLGYNPTYIDAMPLEKVKGLQCHEVLHLACCHHTRRGNRDSKLWNMACDYAINPLLLEAGIELPNGFLDDPIYHGKPADAIYKVLIQRDEEIKGGAEGGPQEEIETHDEIDGDGIGAENPNAEEEGEPDGSSSDMESEKTERSGGEGDDENADTANDNDPGMAGEVRDASSGSQGEEGGADIQREEESWRTALAQAVNKSRECGDLPGSLERLITELLYPPLSWRELLRQFLDNTAKNDFTWVRPNRRYLHAGIYLPGLENEELADIAVAVDVSGSIDQRELNRFAAELSAVLEEFDTTLTVFTCDAAVTTEQQLARWNLPLEFSVTGGGGTDFRPPFERLERRGEAPACLIYFTDMECRSFPQEPEFPVLWVTPTASATPPPFGDIIVME